MTTVDVQEANAHLSQLLDRVAKVEAIVIAKAGEPVARLVPVEVVPAAQRRVGFLRDRIDVPDDFDRLVPVEEIPAAFRDMS